MWKISYWTHLIIKVRIFYKLDAVSVSSGRTESVVIPHSDSKLNKLKVLYDKVRQLKVKLTLKQRYSCSNVQTGFQTNLDHLYKVLDTRNVIKLYLQFEKLKQILFSPKQKFVFEMFNVDINFINDKLYNKNVEEMNEEELTNLVHDLETLNDDSDPMSRSLIKLLHEDFKKIIFE